MSYLGSEPLWIGIAGAVGCLIGEGLRRWLNTLKYRVTWEDSDEVALTPPGVRWWVPVVLGVGWACTVWLVPSSQGAGYWAHLAGWLGFCTIGLWLAAIDLDVRRLPDKGQLVLACITIVCGILVWPVPQRLLIGLVSGLLSGLAFLIIHLLSRGDLGFGDVKLVMICGWWLGLISPLAVFTGLCVACLLALVFCVMARVRQFAFGPWLIAGTVLAGLVLPT